AEPNILPVIIQATFRRMTGFRTLVRKRSHALTQTFSIRYSSKINLQRWPAPSWRAAVTSSPCLRSPRRPDQGGSPARNARFCEGEFGLAGFEQAVAATADRFDCVWV